MDPRTQGLDTMREDAYNAPDKGAPVKLRDQVERFEQSVIESTLAMTNGNVRAACHALDTAERTIWDKIEKYGINTDAFRPGADRDDIATQEMLVFVEALIESFASAEVDQQFSGDGIDTEELAQRLHLAGHKTDDPGTIGAITKAFVSGSFDHI